MNKSMIDTAYDVAKSKGKLEQIKFEDLLVRTMVAMGVSADDNDKIIAQAGKLYTDLTMDGRFLQVKVEKDDSSKKKSKGKKADKAEEAAPVEEDKDAKDDAPSQPAEYVWVLKEFASPDILKKARIVTQESENSTEDSSDSDPGNPQELGVGNDELSQGSTDDDDDSKNVDTSKLEEE